MQVFVVNEPAHPPLPSSILHTLTVASHDEVTILWLFFLTRTQVTVSSCTRICHCRKSQKTRDYVARRRKNKPTSTGHMKPTAGRHSVPTKLPSQVLDHSPQSTRKHSHHKILPVQSARCPRNKIYSKTKLSSTTNRKLVCTEVNLIVPTYWISIVALCQSQG